MNAKLTKVRLKSRRVKCRSVNNLAIILKERKLKIKDLSKKINVSRQTIIKWKLDGYGTQVNILVRFLKELDINLNASVVENYLLLSGLLFRARQDKGISREALARTMNVSHYVVVCWEKTPPKRLEAFFKLLKELSIDIKDLLTY